MDAEDADLSALLDEHEKWAQNHKAAFSARHPQPVGAWDANSLYRQIQEWNSRWLREIKPHAIDWWAVRGYRLVWVGRKAHVEKI